MGWNKTRQGTRLRVFAGERERQPQNFDAPFGPVITARLLFITKFAGILASCPCNEIK